MRPIIWFLLAFVLAVSAGVATAGYTFGDGQCYDTKPAAMEAAYRSFPRLVGPLNVESNLLNMPDPCVESLGYYTCTFVDGLGATIGAYRLYPTQCDQSESDITFNEYWLAPAVLLMAAVGFKLGAIR